LEAEQLIDIERVDEENINQCRNSKTDEAIDEKSARPLAIKCSGSKISGNQKQEAHEKRLKKGFHHCEKKK